MVAPLAPRVYPAGGADGWGRARLLHHGHLPRLLAGDGSLTIQVTITTGEDNRQEEVVNSRTGKEEKRSASSKMLRTLDDNQKSSFEETLPNARLER